MCCKRARPHKGRPTSLIRDIRDRASGGNQTYEASHPSRARPSEPNSTPPTGPAGLLMQPETASAITPEVPYMRSRSARRERRACGSPLGGCQRARSPYLTQPLGSPRPPAGRSATTPDVADDLLDDRPELIMPRRRNATTLAGEEQSTNVHRSMACSWPFVVAGRQITSS